MVRHAFVILAYNESDDLEECIKSVLNQSVKSSVVIATSTPNDYIMDLASKYALGVMVNDSESNKGNDYNYAINCISSNLVTIAHQDDLYDRNYTKEILDSFEKNPDTTIFFTDNYFIVGDKKIKNNKQLRTTRWHLLPLKFKLFNRNKYFKLRSLKSEKYICTSSITFVKKNLKKNLFPIDLLYYNDWKGLITLAKDKTKFVYIDKKLVGYRETEKEENSQMQKEKQDILNEL